MDFYAADGDFVNPLPYHRMREYPYSQESFPQDDVHLGDVLNYDTRFFSGTPAASYSFRYAKKQSGARQQVPAGNGSGVR